MAWDDDITAEGKRRQRLRWLQEGWVETEKGWIPPEGFREVPDVDETRRLMIALYKACRAYQSPPALLAEAEKFIRETGGELP